MTQTTSPPRDALREPAVPGPSPDATWRELMSAVLDGPFAAEDRLEALLDHIERAGRRPGR